jgi:hypothetical protein
MTQPADPGIGGDEGDGLAVGEHGVALDRHRPLPEQPITAGLQQQGEDPYRLKRISHPVARSRLPRADLHAHVLARQHPEGILVGDVIADEQHGTRGRLPAQLIDGGPLVAGEHRQLDDLLALRGVHVGPLGRAGADLVHDGLGDILGGRARVDRDGGRLGLKLHPGMLPDKLLQHRQQPAAQLHQMRLEPGHESDIKLGPMASHQMDLAG